MASYGVWHLMRLICLAGWEFCHMSQLIKQLGSVRACVRVFCVSARSLKPAFFSLPATASSLLVGRVSIANMAFFGHCTDCVEDCLHHGHLEQDWTPKDKCSTVCKTFKWKRLLHLSHVAMQLVQHSEWRPLRKCLKYCVFSWVGLLKEEECTAVCGSHEVPLVISSYAWIWNKPSGHSVWHLILL